MMDGVEEGMDRSMNLVAATAMGCHTEVVHCFRCITISNTGHLYF